MLWGSDHCCFPRSAFDFIDEGFIPGVYGLNLHLCYGGLFHFCQVVYLFVGESITYPNGVSVNFDYAKHECIPHHFGFHLFRVPSLFDELFYFGDKFFYCHFPLFEAS